MLPVYGIYFGGKYQGGIAVVAAKDKKAAIAVATKHVARYYHDCTAASVAHRLRGCLSKTKGVKITDYYTE